VREHGKALRVSESRDDAEQASGTPIGGSEVAKNSCPRVPESFLLLFREIGREPGNYAEGEPRT
jgi:hypothetical protein